MHKIIAGVVICLLGAGVASAQPGQPQPAPPQPYPPQQPGYPPQQPGYPPQGYPQQPGYPPQGYPQQPPVVLQLTAEDNDLLRQGEITDIQVIGGAASAIFLGFGTGQAIQGRWGDKGWIFTLGEIGTLTMMIYGAVTLADDCLSNDPNCNKPNNDGKVGLIVTGAIGFSLLRIWEIVDSIAGPSEHNSRVRELRIRTGYRDPGYARITPYITPMQHNEGVAAGFSFRF